MDKVRWYTADFYKKAELDKARAEELQRSYPTLFKAYQSEAGKRARVLTFPQVVREFNAATPTEFNDKAKDGKALTISRFVKNVLPQIAEYRKLQDSHPDKRALRREMMEALDVYRGGRRGFSGKAAPYKLSIERYEPVRLASTDEELAEARKDHGGGLWGHGTTILRNALVEPIAAGAEEFTNTIVPRVSLTYGAIPPDILRPVAVQGEVLPQRIKRLAESDLPELGNMVLDEIPAVADKAQKAIITNGIEGSERVLKRLGYASAGALLGGAIGLGLSKGLVEDGSGYDIPSTLLGAGLGGLAGYYAASPGAAKDLRNLLERNKYATASAGLGLGSLALYLAMAKKRTFKGAALSTLAGALAPAAVKAIRYLADRAESSRAG